MYAVDCYVAYLAFSVALTVLVARTLRRSGRLFLVQVFKGDAELADSVTHLLVMGFYLINFGYVALALRTAGAPDSLSQSFELLSGKLGAFLLVLGITHCFNLFILSRFG